MVSTICCSPPSNYAHHSVTVSQPRLQHTASQHSVTASEDYYSLSSESTYSDESIRSVNRIPIQRHSTPPSRYRTPMHSHERLPRDLRDPSRERRTTPMSGQGRRRRSDPNFPPPNPLRSNPRTSPVRRKPIPSTVYEGNSPQSDRHMSPENAQSSAAKEIARGPSPPTPHVDDTPYIQFALDQLTRDEEVRGSRLYPGSSEKPDLSYQPGPQVVDRSGQPSSINVVSSSPYGDSRTHFTPPLFPRRMDASNDRGRELDSGELRMTPPEAREERIMPVQVPPRHPYHNVSPELRTQST